MGIPLAAVDRAAYVRSVAALHAALTPESFDAAFAAGRALTLDQAVREALAIASMPPPTSG